MFCGRYGWRGVRRCWGVLKHITPLSEEWSLTPFPLSEGEGRRMFCGRFGCRVVSGSKGVLKHITPLSLGEGLGVRLLGVRLLRLFEQPLLIEKQHILFWHGKRAARQILASLIESL